MGFVATETNIMEGAGFVALHLGHTRLSTTASKTQSQGPLWRAYRRRAVRANLLDGSPGGLPAELPPALAERIKDQVQSDKVVLYMKGVPDAPQCGFSQRAVAMLEISKARYTAFNVLADESIRQGIKVFSQWPTIPQLYIDGEFIGGADIMEQLYNSGELVKLLIDADAI